MGFPESQVSFSFCKKQKYSLKQSFSNRNVEVEVFILNVVFFSNSVLSPEDSQRPVFLRSYSLISHSSRAPPALCLWRSASTTLPYLEGFAAHLSPVLPIRVVLYWSLSQSCVSHVLLRTAHFPLWTLMWNYLPYRHHLHLGFSSFSPTSLSVFVRFLFAMHLFSICPFIEILCLCSLNQMCVMSYQRRSQFCGQN